MRSDFMFSPKCSAFWRPTVDKKYTPERISKRVLRHRDHSHRRGGTTKGGKNGGFEEDASMPEVPSDVCQ